MTVYIPSPNVAGSAVRPSIPRDAIRVAAFTCRGLESLSRELGFEVAVVAAVPDVARHRELLGERWYASGVAKTYDEWPLPFDFDNWDYRAWLRIPLDGRWFGGRPHPLAGCLDDGDILLSLPVGVTPRAFSEVFRDGLRDLRFEAVARRPAHLVRRHHARRPVAVASRYARASATSDVAVEVRDLVHFGPRTLRRVADVALAALGAPAGHSQDVVAP